MSWTKQPANQLETEFLMRVCNISTAANDKEERFKRISVLGTGNYGHALTRQLYLAGADARVGSRYAGVTAFQGLPLMTYEEAIENSDIVFLCIPAHAYGVLPPLKELLAGKTVVDISNLDRAADPSNAQRLQSMLPLSYVMKALNTVSAYTLEQQAYGASRNTYVCGDNDVRKFELMQVLREIGLNPIDRGSLRSAPMLEKLPFRFFSGWGTAILITFLTLIPIMLYTYLRHFWYTDKDNRADEDLPLYTANRTIAWLMFWLLALTYLPGILAGFIQVCAGTKYMRFPNWLDRWMKSRKQLGLISLLLATIHACMSCLLMGAGEIKYMLTNTYISQTGKAPVVLYQLLDTEGQVSLLFAVLGWALMLVLGVTSLPSINAQMSWREWDFVQRGLGFMSLVFGFIHVVVYMYKLWNPDYKFGWAKWEKHPRGIFPPAAFVMPLLPMLVIFLKIVLMLPGLSCYLYKIRSGKIGYKQRNITV